MASSGGWKTLIPCRRIPKEKQHELEVDHVGLFSFLTITWMDRLMWRAFRKGLQNTDIKKCPDTESVEGNTALIEALWAKEVEEKGPQKANLSRILLGYIRCRLVVACLLLLLACVGILAVVAFFMNAILQAMADEQIELWHGLVLMIGLFCVNMLSTLFFVGAFSIAQVGGARIRSGTLGMLYKKLLSTSSVQNKTIGKLLNLYANDGQRLMDGISIFPMLIGGPMLALGATAYALYLLGVWALIGFAILLLLFPLQMTAGKFFMKFRAQAIALTDQRVRQMSEYLSNMKFIKMYTWEKPLSKLISDIRHSERTMLEKVNISMSMAFITASSVVATSTMITLIVYVLSGKQLTAPVAFIYVTLYSSIQERLELTTIAVKELSEFFIACKRIQEVMLMRELKHSGTTLTKPEHSPTEYVVTIYKACFSWPAPHDVPDNNGNISNNHAPKNHKGKKEIAVSLDDLAIATQMEPLTASSDNLNQHIFALTNISLKVEKGEVIGMAGPLGSGKSALLTALIGQMDKTAGDIQVSSSLAYVPQQAWIFNGTLRENIVWGLPFEEERYQSVLEACCLMPDLAILASGDLTEIGERGINLSGGQKQRISLARAVYADRQLYLLDDPLASVDPDVAESLFKQVIQDLLVGKTIFFVTSQVKFLQECDQVLYLQGGKILEAGSPEELLEAEGYFADLYYQATKGSDDGAVDEPMMKTDFGISVENLADATEGYVETEGDELPMDEEVEEKRAEEAPLNAAGITRAAAGQNLTHPEVKEVGAVGCQTYRSYTKAAGGPLAIIIVVILSLLAEGSRAFSYFWLGVWININSAPSVNVSEPVSNVTRVGMYHISLPEEDSQVWIYHLVYGMSLLAILGFFFLRSIILVKLAMKASSKLHDLLFKKILRCPMSFFDTTPIGQIINRFSRDMDELDAKLPPLIDNTLKTIVSICLYLILIGILLPWFLVGVPILAIILIFFYAVFRVGTRELKRLQLLSMAPLLSHVNSTLEGLHCIRAYSREPDQIKQLTALLDANTSRSLLYQFSTRWINIRLAVVTSAILSLVAILIFLLRGSMPVEFAGTAIIYAVQLLALFQFFVRFAVESEATFTSAERIRTYLTTLPSEGDPHTKNFPIPVDWPSSGMISFNKFQLRYRPGLPLVLKDLNIPIGGKQKVGIVGRTGSGKSSLATALFRIVEPAGGEIYIDSIDTRLVGLEDLRTQLSIIPQDPVLFSGTLRSNLDPFKRHIDLEIWRALEKVHMKDRVNNLEKKLDAPVAERGENYSVGERQLLCMARVLLCRTKILILDEATAAIDTETERLIQQSLKESFTDITVLVIAHRLQTVMECHKVVVMESGQVLEYDSPSSLMADQESRFYKMVMIAGQGKDSQESETTTTWV